MMQKPVAPIRRGEDNIFVWAATTGQTTLSGEQAIDGEDLVAGDYVLVWKQDDDTENGIYRVREDDWEILGQIGLAVARFGSQYKESMFALVDANEYKQVSGAPGVVNVRCAATANLSPTGSATIDGVSVATDDLVLLKSQSTASERAVWKVDTSGAWEQQSQPELVTVTSGTLYGGCAFFLSTTNTYTGLGAFYK